ncbi:putative bifunctional diguanylate cyclase/phosphodiesterase [Shewanella youngdeokensis]|uniref:EAL domain-containing protein n=1 Tax=Shewanella youngdeokensis TaxID=2999068 RepID=A0ABZ0JTQ6_9GAMM|nr:EAL domain-containing protein [Shewanella sp. DAU334]
MDILLVDDDMVDRAAIVRTLKKSDLSVRITEAITVEQGLQLYSENTFDVVLLDYNLPLRDGIEMMVEIRNESKNSSIAIVMMSGSEDEALALECIKAGAQDFLVKSEISEKKLRRAILHSTTRNDLEKKLYETYQKVKSLAETDSLTGLPNRYFFDESLKLAIANNRRHEHTLALLLLDIDNFKLINDNFGHDVGDVFLKKTVSKIKACLRGNELFSRLGGDEFAITLCNLESSEQAHMIAQRIIAAMQVPLELASTTINSTVSIGIALHPVNGGTSEELFKYADIAMYRAKKQGRNQVCFFEDEMQQKFHQRLKVEIDLRTAIEKNQFHLHYQPVIDPANEHVTGFEALLRWNIDGRLRSPCDFIEIAEETHQISMIGLWVIEEAISTLSKWNRKRAMPFTMSINVSAIQLGDLTIVKSFKNLLEKYQVPAELIEIELTETALFKDTLTTRQVIEGITGLGCRLSLDDFGTGFSSIAHLRNYPISIVKIDKSLMPKNRCDLKRAALIEGLVSMAGILGIDIVAEGIETQAHADLCKDLQIQSVQGFYYSHPVAQLDIEKSHFLQ